MRKSELIEYAKYVDNYYGTPRAYVEEQLEAGKDVILEIEIQGALKVKEKFPETLLLFVTPPSARELKDRLVKRGTESMEVILSRMERAREEAKGMDRYDYLVINDDAGGLRGRGPQDHSGRTQEKFPQYGFYRDR